MDGIMSFIGVVVRTPFALVGLLIATVVAPVSWIVLVLMAVLWIVVYLPSMFVLTALEPRKNWRGQTRSDRFREMRESNVRNWKRYFRDWIWHPKILKWWFQP